MEAVSINLADVVVIYMGEGGVLPRDVVRARVNPSITVVPEKAFMGSSKLEEVELYDGLMEIGTNFNSFNSINDT